MTIKTNKSWNKIFKDYKIAEHDFDRSPFHLSADQIKIACRKFKNAKQKEPYPLCKQGSRESRPDIFKEHGLFLLPIKNGLYSIIRGEGYVDTPPIKGKVKIYNSKLTFPLDAMKVGDSEIQHLDYAYATSLIRTFMQDDTLFLAIRGRKYTPKFKFFVGKQKIEVASVQTEVDAGYEGAKQIVLIEAKNIGLSNVIIRQLYYPFRQWQKHTKKKVISLFFEKSDSDTYSIWQFKFSDKNDYNSIELVKSKKFQIIEPQR